MQDTERSQPARTRKWRGTRVEPHLEPEAPAPVAVGPMLPEEELPDDEVSTPPAVPTEAPEPEAGILARFMRNMGRLPLRSKPIAATSVGRFVGIRLDHSWRHMLPPRPGWRHWFYSVCYLRGW